MNISIENQDQTIVVSIDGRVDAITAKDFESALSELPETYDQLLIDTSKLVYISSAGLRVFLSLAKQLKESQKAFAIFALQDSVRRVFQVSGFDKIIPLFDTQNQAIDSLSSGNVSRL